MALPVMVARLVLTCQMKQFHSFYGRISEVVGHGHEALRTSVLTQPSAHMLGPDVDLKARLGARQLSGDFSACPRKKVVCRVFSVWAFS
ncbi:hypothetical protein EG68_08437 [Paragonimus skrjabini miyazakii]|uniref:Uncharacterized protein n=1 Tax=Paragonimus skrjabini miyazakii TaxID=59628 RepID=A0A8S9YZ69_9TREM|nr:hypothetical protein EG68_08437 [Paragonimus skrjabini miyazakii]